MLWRDPAARLVLTANFLLITGAGLIYMTLPWLLIHEPNGENLFGLVNAGLTLLVLLLLPAVGKLIDRSSRKQLILAFLIFSICLDSVVIAASLIQGRTLIWHLLLLYSLGSLAQSIFYPAEFALNQEIFRPEQYQALAGAIEVQWQAGSMLAGGLGALLVGRVPLWAILTLDLCTYCTAFFLFAKVAYQRKTRPAPGSAWNMAVEAFTYLRRRRRLFVVIFASFLPFVGLMGANYLAPIFVKDTLRAGPGVYGLAESSYAIGAVLAGLTVGWCHGRWGLIPTLLATIGVFTCATALIPLFPATLFFLAAFVLQGWGNAGSRVARSILVLNTVPNEIVGRVNLLFSALERCFRACLILLVTRQVALGGPRLAYWWIVALGAFGLVLTYLCRRVRIEKRPAMVPVGSTP